MKNKNSVVNSAENLSMFLTFFTLSWIIYLFPEVISNFFPTAIAKLLLAASAFSLSLFENDNSGSKKDEKNKDESINLGIADFGVGLGMFIIFVGFINSFDSLIYKLIMLTIFAFFGCFGMYRGLCIPIVKALFHNEQQIIEDTKSSESSIIKEPYTLSTKIFNIILNIFELGAAIVTILTFSGVSF